MNPKFLKRIVASYVREKEVSYLESKEKGRGGLTNTNVIM